MKPQSTTPANKEILSPAPISREVEGFTPGEWEFNQEENTVSKYRIYSTKDGRNVGWFDYDEETKESELANVTLIASAPTLYRENQQQAKDIELLREALQGLHTACMMDSDIPTAWWAKHKETVATAYEALKQTEPKQ